MKNSLFNDSSGHDGHLVWTNSTVGDARVQINISARHGELSGSDQTVIREKAEKLRRFLDRISAIEVTVDLQRVTEPHLELVISAEHAPEFVASATAPTVISAIEAAVQKAEQQLRKFKEKHTDHKATGLKHIETPDQADDEER